MVLGPIRRTGRGVETGGRGGAPQATPEEVPAIGAARDPGLSVNANQFGAQVGRALQDVGAGLANVAEAQRQLAVRRQDSEDKMFLARAESELNRRLFEDEFERERSFKTGEDAFAIFQEREATIRQEVLAGLQEEFQPSQEAMDRYNLMAEGQASRYGLRTVAFENNQHVALYEQNFDKEIIDLTRTAFMTGDFDGALATLEDRIAAAEGVFTPDVLAAKANEARRTLSMGYLNGIARDDPGVLWGALRGESEGSIIGAIIQQESAGNPNAVSSAGAAGLMQVMPGTGAEIAREIGDPDFPFTGDPASLKKGSAEWREVQEYLKDPEISVRYGTHFFKKMLRRYDGDMEAALVAYNGGPRRADNWLAAGRDDSVLPEETSNYYKEVIGRMAGADGSPLDAALGHVTANDQITLAGRAERGRNVMIRKFEDRFSAHLANIEQFGTGMDGFSLDEADGFLTPEEMVELENLEDEAFADHTSINAIMFGTQAEAVSELVESQPQPGDPNIVKNTKRHTKFKKAFDERRNATDSFAGSDKFDPAGFVGRGFEDVGGAYTEALASGEEADLNRAINLSLEAQRDIGVADGDLRILPKQAAKQFANEINTTPSGERAAKIAQMQEQFGEFAPQFIREVSDAGLDPAAAVAALYIDETALSQEIITASENLKQIKETLPQTTVKDVEDAIALDLEEFRTAFQAGDHTGASAEVFNQFRDAVTAVALSRASRGATDSGETVDQMVNDRFHVGLFGGTVYAPKQFSDSDIESAGDTMRNIDRIRAFEPESFKQLGIAEFLNEERTINKAVRDGVWVTNPEGNGVVLMVPIGGAMLPLRDRAGNLYGFAFNEASSIASETPEAEIEFTP